jgi:hypothetical protein
MRSGSPLPRCEDIDISFHGMSKSSVDPNQWVKVASGNIGDKIWWEAGFEVLGEVRSILVQLEEIGDEETIDWKIIIGDHLYFEPMSYAEFPPLYNEQDFETLSSNEFLAIIEEPDGFEMAGQSFNWFDLYVDADRKEPILKNFENFATHLRSLKSLSDADVI